MKAAVGMTNQARIESQMGKADKVVSTISLAPIEREAREISELRRYRTAVVQFKSVGLR